MYKKIKLNNGIRAFLIPSETSKSICVSVYVKAGARFENEKNNGIAHFLEHMIFKGTKDFPRQIDLAKYVEELGADWDAYTDTELIKFYIRAEASNIKALFYILNQMLQHSLFEDRQIENEKGVIIEEINMHNDNPEQKVYLLADAITWPNHPLGRNLGGTKENVQAFKREGLIDYMNKYFVSGNIVVGVSGKFEEAEVTKLLNDNFGSFKANSSDEYEKAPEEQKNTNLVVDEKKNDQVQLCMNFRGVSANDERRYSLTLLSVILGGGISSRLFQKIRTELNLAYYIVAHPSYYMDAGMFQISAGLNKLKTVEAVREILKILSETKKGSLIVEEELERAKNHLIGVLALSLEEHHKMNGFLCNQELLLGKVTEYEEMIKKVKRVTISEIVAMAKLIFTNENLNIALVGDVNQDKVKEVAHIDS